MGKMVKIKKFNLQEESMQLMNSPMKKQTVKKVPRFNLIIQNQKRETKTLKNVPVASNNIAYKNKFGRILGSVFSLFNTWKKKIVLERQEHFLKSLLNTLSLQQ